MGYRARQSAREGVLSDEDRELKAHLGDARRSLEKALSVCRRVSSLQYRTAHSNNPKEEKVAAEQRIRAARGKRNAERLLAVINNLQSIESLKSSLSQDVDLLPESVRAAMSRQALKDRVAKNAKKRITHTEQAVRNVLASLAVER